MPLKINSKLDLMFGRCMKKPSIERRRQTGLAKVFCSEKNLTICSVGKGAFTNSAKSRPCFRADNPADTEKCLLVALPR
ncbi:hypothetical protein [Rhizobium sp. J15]|uniref:hypothetical protein n=1 Tax=Rhizobium sp. J15 TaxID=2035450 RepID=UPI001596685D|nr:hypothetical protein [Rhizobium sp. J15]